jgi:two-component system response regulator HydG
MIQQSFNVEIDTALDGREALQKISSKEYDVAFIDVNIPHINGLKVLEESRKLKPDMEVVMFTGYAKIEDAVKSIKLGALDYVAKPFKLGHIFVTLNKVYKMKVLKEENRLLKDQLRGKFRATSLVGMTPQMEKVNELIDKVRNEDCNILIIGESGTGKELVARAIHFEGKRKERLFIPIDCASIHKNLFESELFGHEKGAFTGAYTKKIGLLEKASGGTAFFDEIAEIPIELQPVLLRSIEEKRIRPVGGTNFIDIDVRIIAATNRDLYDLVDRGFFRRDLFYRLNVVTITIPPLRDRKDDIPLLVDHFINRFSKRTRKNIRGITWEALFTLMRYDWPGNVRELEHVIEQVVTIGIKGSKIELADIPQYIISYVEEKSLGRRVVPSVAYSEVTEAVPSLSNISVDLSKKSLKEIETDLIVRTVADCKGDTLKAAKILKINRSTIYRRLKRSKLTVDDIINNTKSSINVPHHHP